MDIRRKKLIGTAIFVASSVFYFFFWITVAMARLPGTAMATQLLFYFVITMIWVFFSALLIRWMQKPAANPARQK
jgi:glucan phosphoethanolaminetransferase (alkaline phosphatase superfamily)